MMPGLGIDPAKLLEVQNVSKYIRAVIRTNYKDKTVQLALSSEIPEAHALIPELLGQFSVALSQQLHGYFAIEGELVETGKE